MLKTHRDTIKWGKYKDPQQALPVARFYQISLHYYRMDLLSRAVTAFSPGYRAGTTILGLKVEPSVLGHRAGTKEGPLVPVGPSNRANVAAPFSPGW